MTFRKGNKPWNKDIHTGLKPWNYIDGRTKNIDKRREVNRERERGIKAKSVEYKGGACQICGLKDNCLSIYDFHHTDPTVKEFKLSGKLFSSKELDKCILVCSNCHRKIHTVGDYKW